MCARLWGGAHSAPIPEPVHAQVTWAMDHTLQRERACTLSLASLGPGVVLSSPSGVSHGAVRPTDGRLCFVVGELSSVGRFHKQSRKAAVPASVSRSVSSPGDWLRPQTKDGIGWPWDALRG